MGLFARKHKKTPSITNSPTSQSVSAFATSPIVPSVAAFPEVPRLSLRVAVDPVPAGTSPAGGLFYIYVDPKDDVSAIRRAVSEKLGDVSLGMFKVSIPWQARQEARAYTERYDLPVNLIASYPCYNLDDPAQLAPSLGPAGWTAAAGSAPSGPRIKDWYPLPVTRQSDIISVLVRVAATQPANEVPLTIMAHFAPPDPPRSSRPSSSNPPIKSRKRLPTVVDIATSSSVSQLKAAVLMADGRAADSLDSVVLWRVEMSEEEMIVIGERGGLKGGRMPWPYPPTAPVPTALTNPTLSVLNYFPDSFSNGRLISLSIWIHPSASERLARQLSPDAEAAPIFTYPMNSLSEAERLSLHDPLSPRTQTRLDLNTPPLPPLPTTILTPRNGQSRRGRPSTAPAASGSSSGSPQLDAFGSRTKSLSSAKGPSALSSSIVVTPPTDPVTDALPRFSSRHAAHRGSESDVSEHFDSTPSLNFSQLSLSISTPETNGGNTPVTPAIDWLSPDLVDEHARALDEGTVKAMSLGPTWHRPSRDPKVELFYCH